MKGASIGNVYWSPGKTNILFRQKMARLLFDTGLLDVRNGKLTWK